MLKIVEVLLYFFCFFPFLKIFRGGGKTDVQPYALCVAALIIVIFILFRWKIIINKDNVFFYVLICIATIILGISVYLNDDIYHCIRSYLSYINIGLITICTYLLLKKKNCSIILREKWIKTFINIWLIVGLIQKFINRQFLNIIISNARTTTNRGICSLASEPSFYGYMCIFFLFFVFFFKNQKFIYTINLLFQIFFLAQSSVTLVYLCVLSFWYCVKILSKMDIKKIVLFFSLCICTLAIISIWAKNNQHIRIGNLTYQVVSIRNINDLLELVERDESINRRVADITFCFREFVNGYGVPHGFSSDKRIESGYGMALFELGIFGIWLIAIIWKKIYQAYPSKHAMMVANTLTFIMFSAVQLSLPTLAFFIGYCCYRSNNTVRNHWLSKDRFNQLTNKRRMIKY